MTSYDTASPYYEYKAAFLPNNSSIPQVIVFIVIFLIQMSSFVILFRLSWKTCNISRSNFKDTKRTNFIIISFFLVYGSEFAFRGSNTANLFNNTAVSFLSQLIIFPPIVLPIIYHLVVFIFKVFSVIFVFNSHSIKLMF